MYLPVMVAGTCFGNSEGKTMSRLLVCGFLLIVAGVAVIVLAPRYGAGTYAADADLPDGSYSQDWLTGRWIRDGDSHL